MFQEDDRPGYFGITCQFAENSGRFIGGSVVNNDDLFGEFHRQHASNQSLDCGLFIIDRYENTELLQSMHREGRPSRFARGIIALPMPHFQAALLDSNLHFSKLPVPSGVSGNIAEAHLMLNLVVDLGKGLAEPLQVSL